MGGKEKRMSRSFSYPWRCKLELWPEYGQGPRGESRPDENRPHLSPARLPPRSYVGSTLAESRPPVSPYLSPLTIRKMGLSRAPFHCGSFSRSSAVAMYSLNSRMMNRASIKLWT